MNVQHISRNDVSSSWSKNADIEYTSSTFFFPFLPSGPYMRWNSLLTIQIVIVPKGWHGSDFRRNLVYNDLKE